MLEHLSPRQLAEAIGVSESSIRRWADDGKICITRTAGGHRKIARTEAIRFVREGALEVQRPDLLSVSEPPHRHQRAAAFGAQHDELLTPLRNGDAELVFALVARMYVNGVTVAEICDGPIRNAMYQIGEMWPDQKQCILVEHRATNICVDALLRLRSNFPKPLDDSLVAVGGAPEKDPFMLSSMMVSTVLADLGYKAVNLGPNTPIDVISQAAIDLDAQLAWLSLTAPLPKPPVNAALTKAANQLGRHKTQLVLGGQVAGRYQLPDGKHVHAFQSLSELAGFAKATANA